MDGGGIGETIGVATVGVGLLVGWRFGPQAERKFERIVDRLILGIVVWVVLLLLVFVIWWAITN